MKRSPVIDINRRQMKATLDKYLTCVICQDVQCDNQTCANGHPHCARCLVQMSEVGFTPQQALSCSVCRVRRGWTHPRMAMDLARCTQFLFPCGIEDCPEQCTIDVLSAHRAGCLYKLFECPYECDHRAMPQSTLVAHVSSHKRTVNLSSEERLHMVAYAQTMPLTLVLVLNDACVVCVSVRALRFNDSCMAVRAMVYGNHGRASDVTMRLRLQDLCSDDHNEIVKTLAYDDALPSASSYVHGFENFVTAHNEILTQIATREWTRRDFCNICSEQPYDTSNDVSERVFGITLSFF